MAKRMGRAATILQAATALRLLRVAGPKVAAAVVHRRNGVRRVDPEQAMHKTMAAMTEAPHRKRIERR